MTAETERKVLIQTSYRLMVVTPDGLVKPAQKQWLDDISGPYDSHQEAQDAIIRLELLYTDVVIVPVHHAYIDY